MPNNGLIDCKYDVEARKAVSKALIQIASAESGETKVSFDTKSGQSTVEYRINGKKVSSPLQETMDNGTCKMTGY